MSGILDLGSIDWEAIGLEVAKELVVAGAKYIQSQGTDPHALLNAELDAADAAAIAELKAIDDAEGEES